MARYTTSGFANQEALITAMDGVLVAEGWSQDELDVTNDEAGWNVGNLFVQAAWDNSADIEFHQSTAWDGAGTAPGAHTGDSGSDHLVNAIGNSSGTVHAFTNDSIGEEYAYFVIEHTTGFYRHVLMGNLVKHGAYTGGEFLCGHFWDQGGAIDEPNAGSHSCLFDGAYSVTASGATIKLTNEFPNVADVEWGLSTITGGSIGNDTGGNARYRAVGGMRVGPFVQSFGFMDPDSTDAFVAASPIPVIAKDPSMTTPEHWYWLGELPNIFIGSIAGYTDEEEITFGSETWMIFPLINSTWSAGSGIEQSGNAGVWYRKV